LASSISPEAGARIHARLASAALRLAKSQSMRAAISFAAGGFGFAAGNIVLAKYLSPDAFGVVALLLALNQFGLTFGSFGMDVVVNRHRPLIDRAFATHLLIPAVATSAVMVVLGYRYYGLSALIVALMFVMIVASTVNRVVAGLFQEQGRFRTAIGLLQIHNYMLLVAALLIALLSLPDASLVAALIALGYLCTAVIGWWQARVTMTDGRSRISIRLLLSEGASVVGLNVAVQLLFQFERLVIPKLGSMQMLATYAVVAAVAGSAFRMIQLGNSFTLLPRIRAAPDAASARKVIVHEFITAFFVAVAASLGIVLLSPVIFHYVLHDKYPIATALLAVAIAMGLVRVWEGFSTTIVSALGTPRRLAQLSGVSWVTLAVALCGSIMGSSYGLVGILYGTLSAWVVLAAGGTWLAVLSFRERFAKTAVATASR
jgi:O-antigen/teichoic acid export membrane protein